MYVSGKIAQRFQVNVVIREQVGWIGSLKASVKNTDDTFFPVLAYIFVTSLFQGSRTDGGH